MSLSIACLGWGSLISKPAHHPGAPLDAQGVRPGGVAQGGSWHADGPALPLELARSATSPDPPVVYPSWVITPGVPTSPTLWAPLELPDLVGNDLDRALLLASQALATREGAAISCIGQWPATRHATPSAEAETVAAWARAKHLDGVVWTALPPKWLDAERPPSLAEVMALLRALLADGKAAYAEQYIRETPAQTRSPYRTAIEAELGWRPER